MLLLDTIIKKLNSKGVNTRLEVDARHLHKWICLYPEVFPLYVVKNNFNIIFNETLLRYEIRKNSIQ